GDYTAAAELDRIVSATSIYRRYRSSGCIRRVGQLGVRRDIANASVWDVCHPALRERILSANWEVQMRGLHRWLWAVVAALVCALPGMAHHSFAAEFDASKT